MKLQRFSIFILAFAFLTSCSRQGGYDDFTKGPTQPRKAKKIIVDAGHGGKDAGACSHKDGYAEKELTLKTAEMICASLRQLGYDPILTRNHDAFIPLKKRAEIANTLDCDLFVSIHYNFSTNTKANGIEVFYHKENQKTPSKRIVQSKQLGQSVLDRIVQHTGASSRGVKEANFAVIRETKMPAILIEGGFLSNAEERSKIQNPKYVRYLAWGIAKGIDNYLEGK